MTEFSKFFGNKILRFSPFTFLCFRAIPSLGTSCPFLSNQLSLDPCSQGRANLLCMLCFLCCHAGWYIVHNKEGNFLKSMSFNENECR
ncbi:hypothetical protein VNO77_41869 [Canavalia gladiata]|uniref:Uncharacterized protein n=1 Tax=Canavalia gladiata TaxID=3824 RepID=A0AAN9PSC8_CANGL